MLTFHIPQKAISKDNEKIFNRQGRPFTTKKYKDFEKSIRNCISLQLPPKFEILKDEGIEVTISAMFDTRVRCDVGNIPKGILDAGNGLIWKDDKLITQLRVQIVYGDFNEIMMFVMPKIVIEEKK